jgi:hypothetical protein
VTNEDDKVRIAEVAREYAELLGIDDRRIVIQFDEDEKNWGTMWSHSDYPRNVLTFGPETTTGPVDWPFVDREETAAHELVHVVFNDLRNLMHHQIRPNLPKATRKLLWDLYDGHEERIVETVSLALVAAKRGEKRSSKMIVRDAPKKDD